MDIASLVLDKSELEIVNPRDQKPIGISIEVASPEGAQIKAVNRKWQDKMLSSGDFEISPEVVKQKSTDTRVASILSWEWKNGLTFEGREPDNSEEFKRFILDHEKAWFIRDQLDIHFTDKANFIKDFPEA